MAMVNPVADKIVTPSRPESTPASLPFYIAAFIVTGCGLYAVDMTLADPSFSSLVGGLTIAGFIVSFVSRRRNIAPKNIEIPALFVCACLFFIAVVTDPSQSFLAPAGVAEDRSKSLAVLLTWLTVFRSFTLLNDGALLFSCVPTIALLGLVGTNTSEPLLVTVFLVFAAASIFMMVHENYLRYRSKSAIQPSRMRLNLLNQGVVVGICLVISMFLANLATPLVQSVGSSMRLSAGISLNNRATSASTNAPVKADEKSEVTVGTGPVALSDTLLLRVKSDEQINLRTSSFDHYTGRGWQNLQNIQQSLQPTSTPETGAEPETGKMQLTGLLTYQMQVGSATKSYSSYHRIEQIVSIVSGSYLELPYGGEWRVLGTTDSKVKIDQVGGIYLSEPLTQGAYEIHSDVPNMTADAEVKPPGNYEPGMNAMYTQLPAMKSEELIALQDLSRKITSGVQSAVGKVHAIEQYVGANCKYNTNAASFPTGTDVAYHFLFTSKQGYCDAFATSIAVLCRCAGIPARVASGFLSAERDAKTAEFTIRDRDRHLWTEVFFVGVGWKPFDATGLAEDISSKEEQNSQQKPNIFSWLFKKGILPPLAALAFLLMLSYVFKVEVWDKYRRKGLIQNSLGLPETNYQILREYELACKSLSKRDLRRLSSETIHEFNLRVYGSGINTPAYLGSTFSELSTLANLFRYSTVVATVANVDEATTLRTNIEKQIKIASRLKTAIIAESS